MMPLHLRLQTEPLMVIPKNDQENKTNATMIKNIVLMGSAATTMADLAYYQKVGIVLEYMHQVYVLSDLHTWLSDRTHGLLRVLSDNFLE